MSSLSEQRIGEFLRRLASDAPTPGGGAASGLVGALAAALGAMVTAIARKRVDAGDLERFVAGFDEARQRFLRLSTEDEAAFDSVMQDLRLPKDDPGRPARLALSLGRAAAVPLETASACVGVLELLRDLAPRATRHVTSDIGAAARLAHAAGHSALLNVTINVSYLEEDAVTERLRSERDRLAASLDTLSESILSGVRERIG